MINDLMTNDFYDRMLECSNNTPNISITNDPNYVWRICWQSNDLMTNDQDTESIKQKQ
jgi:hypothetical protein